MLVLSKTALQISKAKKQNKKKALATPLVICIILSFSCLMALLKVQISPSPLAHSNIIFLSHVNSGVWAAEVVLCHKPLKMMFREAMSRRCQRLFMSVLQNVRKQQVLGSVWKHRNVLGNLSWHAPDGSLLVLCNSRPGSWASASVITVHF